MANYCLHVYKSKLGTHVSFSSNQILNALKELTPTQAVNQSVAQIELIQQEGIKYSNQDFDVLSTAIKLLVVGE